ncbi:pre-rRNA processing protein [Irineochytrium annulatum]|nr:pre-rRNA processing protein [Irineochytrium annulatum]
MDKRKRKSYNNPLLKDRKRQSGDGPLSSRIPSGLTPKVGRPRPTRDDREDSGDEGRVEDMNLERHYSQDEEDEDGEDENETAAHKRLRLAKSYLSKLKEKTVAAPDEFDAADIDADLIASRLKQNVLESKRQIFHEIADRYKDMDFGENSGRIRTFGGGKKAHQGPVTGVCIAKPKAGVVADLTKRPNIFVYSVSKDSILVKWDFWTGRKVWEMKGRRKITKKAVKVYGEKTLRANKDKGHTDQIFCVDASNDGKYVATGSKDKTIHLWRVDDNAHHGQFTQHRDAVSGLAFKAGPSNELYSASFDRTVKLWNADELTYVETLFGHQDQIQSIDTLTYDRCITAGARDRTVRLWKIVEEAQLIFRGGMGADVKDDIAKGLVLPSEVSKAKSEAKRTGAMNFGGSVECVCLMDENTFVTGTDSGSISIWNAGRKKPWFTKPRAHGPFFTSTGEMIPSDNDCNWITALGSVRYANVFASGSADGFVRLWKVQADKRSFSALTTIPISGFVNALRFFEGPPLDSVYADEQLGSAKSLNQMDKKAMAREVAAMKDKEGSMAAAVEALMAPLELLELLRNPIDGNDDKREPSVESSTDTGVASALLAARTPNIGWISSCIAGEVSLTLIKSPSVPIFTMGTIDF